MPLRATTILLLACAALVDAFFSRDGAATTKALLRWVGPYPTLALRFPDLATPAQRERGEQGVTLEFVVDTAATVTTINAAVAAELALERVGAAGPGLGQGGELARGDAFLLGRCELGDPALSSANELNGPAPPRLAPAAAAAALARGVVEQASVEARTFSGSVFPAQGLLGSSFLNSFPGGVEFSWGDTPATSPTITFFGEGELTEERVAGLRAAPVHALSATGLPRVTLSVNGVDVPALLDTGSPITVLNAAAAAAARVRVPHDAPLPPPPGAHDDANRAQRLPLRSRRRRLRAARAKARGDTLTIAAADGRRVTLELAAPVELALGGVSLGQASCCFVGEMPGLAALDGLGAKAGPAAVLGVDALRTRPRMIYQARQVLL